MEEDQPRRGPVRPGAPILLFALRILQGAGAGAEQAGSATLLTETARAGRRGRLSASVMVGAAAGTVLGTAVFSLVQLLTTDEQFLAWGWRVVFLMSFLVTGAAFLVRRHLAESPVFVELRDSAEAVDREKAPLVQAVRHGWPTILRAFVMNWGPNTNSYTVQTFFVTFVTTSVVVGQVDGADQFFAKSTITNIQLVGALVGMGSAFLWGRLSDSVGRKPVTVGLAAVGVVLPFVYFALLDTGSVALVAVATLLGFAFAAYGAVGVQMSYFPELFGSRYRYAGITIARELSAVIGGGIAPFICAALLAATGSWVPIAVYGSVTMAFALVASLLAPETADRDLTIPTDAVPGEARPAAKATPTPAGVGA
ncbi:MFS transporter [Xylanimonas protaetiae]|uniref:MFS transporter n=1 Tax=Xylanimonas protaetiae TaxID=2509457 RepID=UPI001A92CBD0|nr:MFS transporter [Xylanimonas protaetiae]